MITEKLQLDFGLSCGEADSYFVAMLSEAQGKGRVIKYFYSKSAILYAP
jgi:hypothetical protein